MNERLAVVATFPVELLRLRRRFDVIHAPEFMAPTLLLPPSRRTAVVVRLSTPTIVTFEFNASPIDLRVRAADSLERLAVKRADVIAAPNSLLVDHLRGRAWIPEQKLVMTPTPVDPDMWSGLPPVEESDPTIVAVGRIEHNKGPDLVIEAAAKIASRVPGLHVVFVGRSSGTLNGRPYMETIESRASELGVRCTFTGELPSEQVRTRYGQARLVSIASRHDNLPNVGLEALAAGRPVVTTTSTGISNVVRQLDAAAVTPKEDAEALSCAYLRYLADPGLAAEVGRRAQHLAGEEFAPKRVGGIWEDLYSEAVNRRRRRHETRSSA